MLWDTDWSCFIRKGTSTIGLACVVFKDAGELSAYLLSARSVRVCQDLLAK